MSRPARALIDLAALKHNLQVARTAAPHSAVMAVIKADAYGHGAIACAHALAQADALAVASIDEALLLRSAGIMQRILLLGGFFQAGELPEIARHGFDVVVHDADQIASLASWVGSPIDVWLKVDTGMHRLGVPLAEVPGCFQFLQQCAGVGEVRLMTHLACADERQREETSLQLHRFAQSSLHLQTQRSIANSAGILGWPETHQDWVRPGIMLYGATPFVEGCAENDGLRPVMSLESQLISLRNLAVGESVGYGASWKAERPVRMGVVAMGYADGYPRHASSGTPVLVDGHRASLIGRVSMDLIAVDVSSVPTAALGSVVRFWGEGLPADEIARAAGTIAYELFTGVTARVPRIYSGN